MEICRTATFRSVIIHYSPNSLSGNGLRGFAAPWWSRLQGRPAARSGQSGAVASRGRSSILWPQSLPPALTPLTAFALLTRLLLCLSLVLNGTGNAVLPMQSMAGGHAAMATAAGAHATHASHAMAHPGPHGHRHGDHATMAMASCHDAAPPPAGCGDGPHDHGGGKDSCCASASSCHCPHAQPLPALAAMPALPAAPPRLAAPAARQHERGSPGLPRLNRPPIA